MENLKRRLSLQAKIILVLVAVMLPTFLIVTIAENKLTRPILEQEIRQMGINAGKRLAAEIVSSRLLSAPDPSTAVENAMQDLLFTEPDILRIEIYAKDHLTGKIKLIASNIEDDPQITPPHDQLIENVTTRFSSDEGENRGVWDIDVPIEQKSRDIRIPRKVLGSIHLMVSTQLVGRLLNTFWKTTIAAAIFSVISLIIAFSYFLRKTIGNDKRLREAETENLELTQQLHETQRQLMTTEKLAVMGQLTASFAHEIGTPLNAIGGHLQLLKEDIGPMAETPVYNRFEIVENQLQKIEKIVKSFLQNTSKPTPQKQLVDLNQLVEKTVTIVHPRVDSLKVQIRKEFDETIEPLRAVALDLEQIILNLLNNSLDSIQSKQKKNPKARCSLEVWTSKKSKLRPEGPADQEGNWTQVTVYDTGEGIRKSDLKKVLKPFYTTKQPGQGTGLGLTICQQIALKYGGDLKIESKEGAWTRVSLILPQSLNIKTQVGA